jgi:nucleotide-binding universal stress UspA family protein
VENLHSQSPKVLNALWPMDPTEFELRPDPSAIDDLRRCLGGFAQTHPIFVCPDTHLPLDLARKQLKDYLAPLELGPTAEADVYRSSAGLRAEWVERILHLAHSQKSRVIVLSSHGRSKLGRLLLGSFAHELLLKADVPVLLIGRSVNENETGPVALFTTDFSAESKRALPKFLELVEGRGGRLILFHAVSFPLQDISIAQACGAPVTFPDEFLTEQKIWAEGQMKLWLQEIKALHPGLAAQGVVEESFSSPADTIAKLAEREKIDLMGLASQTGPAEGFLFGSVTEEFMSARKFHLWVFTRNC